MKTIMGTLLLLLTALTAAAQPSPTKTDAYGDPLPEGAFARLGTARFRHGLYASKIAFSPDGKVVAAVGRFPGLCFWDADTGRLLHRCLVPFSAYALAFSPDGTKLFTGVHLIDVATGKEIRKVRASNNFQAAAFSPNGTMIASADYESRTANVIFWDVNTGQDIRVLKGHTMNVTSLAFSPKDGKMIASASEDKSVRLWDVATGKQLHRFDAHTGAAHSVAFAPNGKLLASAGEDGVIFVWEVATGKALHRIKPGNVELFTVAFSIDGSMLACGGTGGILSLWNPDTGKEVRKWETNNSHISSVTFAPNGKTLALSSSSAIQKWDFMTGKEVGPMPAHRGRIICLKYAPDGKTVFSCGDDRRIREWSLTTSKDSTRLFPEPLGEPGRVFWRIGDISHDGKLLAQAHSGWNAEGQFARARVIRIWNTVTGKELYRLSSHVDLVQNIKFSPNGKLLASSGNDGVRIWDMASGKEMHHLFGKMEISNLAFSSDGGMLAASTNSGQTFLLDVVHGKELRRWEGEPIEQLTFSPDGKLIAASGDDLIRVWDSVTGKEKLRLGSKVQIFSIAFSPDGRTLAVGGMTSRRGINGDLENDGAIQCFEVRTGQEICLHDTRQGWVQCIAFAPHGRSLVSGGVDSTILLWDLTGQAHKTPATLFPVDLDRLWSDLASDASIAHLAHWTLASAPKQSVPFLGERLKPVAAADEQQVAKLLVDLENESISIRQKAMRTLIRMGESAEAGLRKKLEKPPTVEFRSRVDHILQKREFDVIRQLRAIETLEQIGTPETRRTLEAMAKGAPNPRVARSAEAALSRLTP